MENNNVLLLILSILLVASLTVGIVNLAKTNDIEPTELVLPEINVTNVILELPEYMLTQSEFENNATEAEALRLATESVDSRDFKKAVYDALDLFGEDIEDYKDISELKIVDIDVDGNEVSFDIKVYYFIDGDEDEAFKARLNEFTVNVNDLDFDDEFVDAEVDEDYLDNLTVKKVYEI